MNDPVEPETAGVLASLPTTRPQRRSAKRDPPAGTVAERRAKPAAAKAAGRPSKAARSGPAPARPATARAGGANRRKSPGATTAPGSTVRGGGRLPTQPPPAQGLEPDAARGPVSPPSRTDLLGSVAHGAGDLVHAGLGLGSQLLRSVVRRLPGS